MDIVIFCSSIALLVFMMAIPCTATGCFGQGCAFQCHCEGTASCNSVNGLCPNRCASGWAGEYCQRGNAAKGKTARQSSTFESKNAGLAVDNDVRQGFVQCTHTNTENKPWWKVDLGTMYVVFMVTISNRADCDWDDSCKKRLKKFKILMDSSLCHYYTGTVGSGGVVDIRCNSPTVGRVLKIQLQNSDTVLTMCEVMIQAFQYNKPCQNKRYGPNCNNRCQCANNATCNDKTGGCSSGCNNRFTGPYCNIEIPTFSLDGNPTADSIAVLWSYIRPHDSAYDAGSITQYHLMYNHTADSTNGALVDNPKGMVKQSLTGLTPSTLYSLGIQVRYSSSRTGSVFGKRGNLTNIRTKSCTENMVSPVTNATSNAIDESKPMPNRISLTISIKVAGMLSACNSGFDLYFKTSAETKFAKRNNTPTNYALTNLKPYTLYEVKAGVKSSDGKYKQGDVTRITTAEDVPGAPNITNFDASPDSISVTIAPPSSPNGVIKNYTLQLNASTGGRPIVVSFVSKEFPHKVKELDPNTTYNVRAKASTSAGAGNWSAVVRVRTVYYRVDVPETLFPSVMLDKKTATTITINLQKIPKSAKFDGVRKIRIAVDMKSQTRRRRSALLRQEELNTIADYNTANKRDNPGLYIVAELEPSFVGPFTIGDDKSYGAYGNPPLVPGQSYDIIYGLVFQVDGITSFSYRRYGQFIAVETPANIPLIVGIVVCVLVVLAAVIIPTVIILRRKRQRSESKSELGRQPHESESGTGVDNVELDGILSTTEESNEESKYDNETPVPPSQPEIYEMAVTGPYDPPDRTVLISELPTYIKAIRGEKSVEFIAEYGSFPKPDENLMKAARKGGNVPLNRYKNIVAYDHSRVVLQPIGGEKSDYVNACYISGYEKENVYIASQGPLPNTVISMWRMVWQERCTTIVMLTNLVEQGKTKCHQYWPGEGTITVGPFTIKTVETYNYTDYVKRTLTVSLDGDEMTVKHFHFTTWPDHGVPKFACSMLNFRANVLKETEYGKVPILVHCSAGVGRSGTFIGIDRLIRQGQAEGKVNVYDCVLDMRKQRPTMVQNQGQYMHVHDAILEFFKIGITYIKSESYPEVYRSLIEPLPGNAMCKLQNQYSILEAFTDSINPADEAVRQKRKNRSQAILPDDRSRVVLSTSVDGWDDYVNAVYATGYGEKDSYIITQMPFPETTKDIWRIVADTGISTIVMMNVIDDTYEFAQVYWPQEGESMEFGPLVVEGIETEKSDDGDVIIRDFKVSVKKGKGATPVRQIRHFQLQTWHDGQATPTSSESIVKLLNMVEKWLRKVENKMILAQCMDGASQSGVFCTAHSVIEKVKVDHEVDVFQYVRLLRSNRPQLVNTYEQYRFIHEVVMSYLKGFDIYANFQ